MNTLTTHQTSPINRRSGYPRTHRKLLGTVAAIFFTTTILSVLFMSGCRDEVVGTVNVCAAPTVIRTSPVDGGTNESLSKKMGGTKILKPVAVKIVTATFSTPMDARTINSSTFIIKQGTTVLLSNVSYSDTTAILVVQDGLAPNLTYTCTLTTGVKDRVGTPLAAAYVWSFTTIAAGTPVLVSPIDGAINQSIIQTFTWNTVQSASSYRLQVSLDPGFVVTVFNDSTLTNTSTVVSGLTVGSTYYWRVNSKISGGTSAYSNVWNFSTIAVPAAPVLVTPNASAINISTSPTFSWTASPGASSYTLQVSTSSSFVNTVYNNATITGTSQQVTGLVGGTGYFWRVSAKNAAGTSTYSSRSFTTISAGTPTLVAPLDGALHQAVNSTLVWNVVPGAGSYRLQVSTSNTFASTLFNDSTLTNTSQLISGLSIGTTYFWRVNSKISGQTSEYSDVWSFTTIAAPAVPTLVTPLNAAINQPVIATLIWNDVPAAETYRLQVSTSNTFATTVYNDSTRTSTSQQVTGLAIGTTYFWRVNAKNLAGTSAYSTIRSFTTIVAPAAPVLFAPTDAAINQSVNPSLIWLAVSGASTYRLQVSTVNTFATTTYNDSTLTSTSQQVSGLAVGTQYFWRVNAKNAAGTSVYSSIRSFTTIVAPSAPVLVAPLNSATNQSANPTLIWNSVAGASTYRVQVSTVNTFATTLYNDSTRTSTSQLISGLSVGTTYFWRVNAKNAAGTSVFSTVWSFNTTAVPLAPTLIAPSDLATNRPTNPSLSWNASIGANTYRLQLSTSNTFATTLFNDSTITGTSQPITGLVNGTTYFWRVNAKNGSGTSPYSIVRSFTVILTVPQPPILSAPLDAAIDQKLNLSLSWLASNGASSYRVQLDTSQVFANPVVNDSTVLGLIKPVTGLKINTTYYWRVNAKNSGGTSAYSTVWRFTTGDGLAPGAVPLGLASTYGILSSSAITDASGASQIWGDVAMFPGNSNGLLAAQVHGELHIADGVASAVYTDLTTAFNFAKNKPVGITVPDGQDLGSFIVGANPPGRLPPGTYTSSSTLLINTPVILDGGGNADAVWVFQIGSSLSTFSGAPGGDVTLTGSAQQKNVFFVPTAAASIGSGTIFYGNVLAGGDLTLAGGTTVYGRLLAGALGASTLALDGAASTVYVPTP
ncbi:MAG: ice-binding family protein [Bacteroidota bacterium]